MNAQEIRDLIADLERWRTEAVDLDSPEIAGQMAWWIAYLQGSIPGSDRDLAKLVDSLAEAGCPESIVGALDNWLGTPVASLERLAAWTRWATAQGVPS